MTAFGKCLARQSQRLPAMELTDTLATEAPPPAHRSMDPMEWLSIRVAISTSPTIGVTEFGGCRAGGSPPSPAMEMRNTLATEGPPPALRSRGPAEWP